MKKPKILKKIILFAFAAIVLAFIFAKYFLYEVPILMYHRIATSCLESPLLCVSPESFSRQMDFISRNHYRVISLEELVDALLKNKALSCKTVVITFDDGTDDIYQHTLVILEKYRFPATVFVATELAGRPGYLSWEQLKQMQKQGIDIASHTQTHVYLPDIDEEALWREVSESKKRIESRIGKKISLLSYPVGGYNAKVVEFVKMAGYKGACTTNRGRYHLKPEIFALRRIKMTEDSDNPVVMWVKLSGIYNLFRKK